ncbi:MAG TPA: S-layer homology domain-containing protein [Bacillota bacterium]|nr:S-layer homology domain-containing protein [Bacillota bacterium]
MKPFISAFLAFSFLTLLPVVGSAKSPFSDIEGHYAQNDINRLFSKGVVGGVSKDQFMPDKTVTRSEYLRMLLHSLHVKPIIQGPVPFSEAVKQHWASKVWEEGYRSGILLNTDWSLVDPNPNQELTRGEAALLLASALNMDLKGNLSNSFQDLSAVTPAMQQAILGLKSIGVVSGMTIDTYAPNSLLTRGQASILLVNTLDYRESQYKKRMNLQVVIDDLVGEVTAGSNGSTHAVVQGEVLGVGTEIQTGKQSHVTVKSTDGDTLYIGPNSRVTVQQLDVFQKTQKKHQVQAQDIRTVEDAILLRGRADEAEVALNWQTDEPVNIYSIYRARNEDVDDNNEPYVSDSSSTDWTDEELEPGNTYSYKVIGLGEEEQAKSQQVSFEIVKQASFKVWTGSVVAKVKNLFSSESKFEVETPTAIAGVRGTTFSVDVDSSGKSNIGVFTGAVGVHNSQTTEQQTLLTANQQATVPTPTSKPNISDLSLDKVSPFVKESVEQIVTQEKQHQQQENTKEDELKSKFEEKVLKMKNQNPDLVNQILQQSKFEKPPLAPIEEIKKQQEKKDTELLDNSIQNANQVNKPPTPQNSTPSPVSNGGAANHAPVALDVPVKNLVLGGSSVTLTASDLAKDLDTGDQLTVVNATYSTAGIVNVGTANGSLTITPIAVGTTVITATVEDSQHANVPVQMTVNVSTGTGTIIKAGQSIVLTNNTSQQDSVQLNVNGVYEWANYLSDGSVRDYNQGRGLDIYIGPGSKTVLTNVGTSDSSLDVGTLTITSSSTPALEHKTLPAGGSVILANKNIGPVFLDNTTCIYDWVHYYADGTIEAFGKENAIYGSEIGIAAGGKAVITNTDTKENVLSFPAGTVTITDTTGPVITKAIIPAGGSKQLVNTTSEGIIVENPSGVYEWVNHLADGTTIVNKENGSGYSIFIGAGEKIEIMNTGTTDNVLSVPAGDVTINDLTNPAITYTTIPVGGSMQLVNNSSGGILIANSIGLCDWVRYRANGTVAQYKEGASDFNIYVDASEKLVITNTGTTDHVIGVPTGAFSITSSTTPALSRILLGGTAIHLKNTTDDNVSVLLEGNGSYTLLKSDGTIATSGTYTKGSYIYVGISQTLTLVNTDTASYNISVPYGAFTIL